MLNTIILKENEERVLPILWLGEESQLQYDIRLVGRGAKLELLMLLLGKDFDKLDINANIVHESPDTKSNIVVRGALSGHAFVNFDGLVRIEKGAKQTNAWLGAHILLLSKQARGRAVPGLEISENDIKAGHAATVGRVNDMELFYLMSRGISKKTAKSLIVGGFVSGMLNAFPEEIADKARKQLDNYISTSE